jgi:hypothetical protein
LLAGQSVEMLLISFELSGTTPTKGTFRNAPLAQSVLPPGAAGNAQGGVQLSAKNPAKIGRFGGRQAQKSAIVSKGNSKIAR